MGLRFFIFQSFIQQDQLIANIPANSLTTAHSHSMQGFVAPIMSWKQCSQEASVSKQSVTAFNMS